MALQQPLTLLIFALLEVVVENQVFDSLLLFLFCLLLALHSNGKGRVRRQLHCSSLYYRELAGLDW